MTLTADEFDEVHKNLVHLQAMLNVIYGRGIESFDDYSTKIKDGYLWACADSVERALDAMNQAIGRD